MELSIKIKLCPHQLRSSTVLSIQVYKLEIESFSRRTAKQFALARPGATRMPTRKINRNARRSMNVSSSSSTKNLRGDTVTTQ